MRRVTIRNEHLRGSVKVAPCGAGAKKETEEDRKSDEKCVGREELFILQSIKNSDVSSVLSYGCET